MDPETFEAEPLESDAELLALSTAGMMLSPHFGLSELACHCSRHHGPFVGGVDRSRLPPGGVAKLRLLAEWLERVRAVLGNLPMHVLSGYRCPPHNAEIGGAKASKHLKGEATDFTHARLTPRQVQAKLRRAWGAGKLVHGLGESATYTHVDRGDRIARWYYDARNRPHSLSATGPETFAETEPPGESEWDV